MGFGLQRLGTTMIVASNWITKHVELLDFVLSEVKVLFFICFIPSTRCFIPPDVFLFTFFHSYKKTARP